MIADVDYNVSKLYGMLPAPVSGDPTKRTPADNQTVRNVFVIGPDKKIKLILVYPMTTGRNFDEVLRVIDSLRASLFSGMAERILAECTKHIEYVLDTDEGTEHRSNVEMYLREFFQDIVREPEAEIKGVLIREKIINEQLGKR